MAKRLFLILILGCFGANLSPSFLAATDTVELTGVDNTGVVETVPLPLAEPVFEVAKAPVAGATYRPIEINYNVTIVTSKIVGKNLSYYDIYRTGKFIYGHNTANLLGNLNRLGVGDIFTVTESGVTRSYQVTDKVVYEKAENGYLNGSRALTKQVEKEANGYDLSLMTCSGRMYGNGDASHRLVVFANAL